MNDTILVVDVGNTNSVFGLFSNGKTEPEFHKRTVTRKDRTSDELGLFLKGFLAQEKLDTVKIDHAVYSSVVPSFNPIVERMLSDWFQVEALQINYKIKLPFEIIYPRPFEIGADRLVNAAFSSIHYPNQKTIIIDLGTATTFCIINNKNQYCGGVIAPGLKISMDALTRNTAQLPPIVFEAPKGILGESTIESLQSGFFYGWVGLLSGIIDQIKQEYGDDHLVIGTGGLVSTIHAAKPGIFDIIDPFITLKGLQILSKLNR
ncbi:type III pantothenate kinase [Leptospira sp. GIMC2001]|uniref:type III pantothenate kinase n=1 Tax=Leptospira sp. GIMC2001 TaxID=1513297 RepID=UPI00234AD944|nr:type III pantothenate kinase [Leptospira sp. GIMC2001]WCL49583.1 type III pantothenate kinase [Leptospira sp. GIMC2001]